MANTQWGRQETLTFPRHSPIYTYGAIFIALVLTGAFLYLRFAFGQSPLQEFYTPAYLRTAVGGAFNKKDKFQLLYVGEGGRPLRLAAEADLQQGSTPAPNGKHLSVQLRGETARQGGQTLLLGTEQKYNDGPLHEYLRLAVFNGDRLRDIYTAPLLFGILALAVQLPFSIRKDIVRRKELKYGRRLKGPSCSRRRSSTRQSTETALASKRLKQKT